ncbi:PREDICTED: ubiquitin carboxyl-terminal hydrolase 35-like [Drosophila arizonae]|uniref:Ubiquitin carboxyl-terminal hydrolase 35-like n=1 Tax=Drosophila arizonae TaxID=7263 RepID=A0ABM1PSV1_DROAR|nr:PREDICTED: ubiquitin carboxyl-terminal hydrolase 35-like [Drosophila arizonae]
MHYSRHHVLVPPSVLSASNSAMFVAGEQQDSSEYLGYLLNSLSDAEKAKGCVPACDDQLNLTIADKSFSGQLTNIYKCLVCSHESRIPNKFRELQLAFPECTGNPKISFTVQNLIEHNSLPEILDGDNKYACPTCATYCKGEHHMKITQGPRNLIITIKRFGYDRATNQPTKLMHKVYHNNSISLEQYDNAMQQFTILLYRLYAIVIHVGSSLDSGHYYVLARDAEHRWIKFNDSEVSYVKSSEVRHLRSQNSAHMLLYTLNEEVDMVAEEDKENAVPMSHMAPLTLEELPAKLRKFLKRNLGNEPPNQTTQ